MTNMMNNLLARRRRGLGRGRHNERGFTLVEMLVVITIIALIMALVGPRVLNYLTDSREVITETISPPTMMLITMMASGPITPTTRSRRRCSLVS